jgi:hypothetical protein
MAAVEAFAVSSSICRLLGAEFGEVMNRVYDDPPDAGIVNLQGLTYVSFNTGAR